MEESKVDNLIVQEKIYQFHQQLRTRHIEDYKKRVRSSLWRDNLNSLLQKMPTGQSEVVKWCERILQQFLTIPDFKFPQYIAIDVFKLAQQYPCSLTIDLLLIMLQNINEGGINELFQFDVGGFLHRIIMEPERSLVGINNGLIVPVIGVQDARVHQEVVKKGMSILALLCEKSQLARNFLVMNHKCFVIITKCLAKIGNSIRQNYIQVLCSFTKFPFNKYHDQFSRILHKLIALLHEDSSLHQLTLVFTGLRQFLDWNQAWILDRLQSSYGYDVLERIAQLLKDCTITYDPQGNKIISHNSHKEKGELCHEINMLLMFYINVSTNQDFNWEGFIERWFMVLRQEGFSFTKARRDVYFIFNTSILQSESSDRFSCLSFARECIKLLVRGLENQVNEDTFTELTHCIHSLLRISQIEELGEDISQSRLVSRICEAISSSAFWVAGAAKQNLAVGLVEMLANIGDMKLKGKLLREISGFEGKLFAISQGGEQLSLSCAIQQLLQQANSQIEEIV